MSDTIIVATKDDIERIVHQALNKALNEYLPEALNRALAKPYLTKSELMDLTGWSSRQVEYKKSSREIPFIRRGRLVLFPTQEIYSYLEEGRVQKRSSGRN